MSNNVRLKGDLTQPGAMIQRYPFWDRLHHWLLALFFVLAGLSGLALFHPALFGLSYLFGGGPSTRIQHPYLGLVMLLFFLLLSTTVARHVRMEARDWAWLRRIKEVVRNEEEQLPEVGRYNAGQKLVYFVAAVCLLGLLLTGLMIWRAYFSFYFPIGAIRVASVIHAICALVLVCTIIVHIDSAIWVKGSLTAMIRGWVTPGWVYRHHRAWYRDILSHAQNPRSRPD